MISHRCGMMKMIILMMTGKERAIKMRKRFLAWLKRKLYGNLTWSDKPSVPEGEFRVGKEYQNFE